MLYLLRIMFIMGIPDFDLTFMISIGFLFLILALFFRIKADSQYSPHLLIFFLVYRHIHEIILERQLLGEYFFIYQSYSQAIISSGFFSIPIIFCILLIIDIANYSEKIINHTKVTRAISDEKYKEVMGAYAALITVPIVAPILLFLYFNYYYFNTAA